MSVFQNIIDLRFAVADHVGNRAISDVVPRLSFEARGTTRNAAPAGWTGDWHRVASVPMNLLYDRNLGLNEAVRQGDDRYLSRWLNCSDNRAWRTKEGRV